MSLRVSFYSLSPHLLDNVQANPLPNCTASSSFSGSVVLSAQHFPLRPLPKDPQGRLHTNKPLSNSPLLTFSVQHSIIRSGVASLNLKVGLSRAAMKSAGLSWLLPVKLPVLQLQATTSYPERNLSHIPVIIPSSSTSFSCLCSVQGHPCRGLSQPSCLSDYKPSWLFPLPSQGCCCSSHYCHSWGQHDFEWFTILPTIKFP